MEFVATPESRAVLADAVKLVKTVARDLEFIDEQSQFRVLWLLAYKDLRGLEDHRRAS